MPAPGDYLGLTVERSRSQWYQSLRPCNAGELDAAAAEAGVPRSELLNQAVREFLYRLRCERDAERYALHPLTPTETAAWPNEAWPDDDTDWTEVFNQ